MLTGTIKFFNKPKGFGFITSDIGGKEVFLPSTTVAASGIKKVEPGLRVSFQEEADVKGPKAVALKPLDEPRVEQPRIEQPRAEQARPAPVSLYHDPASTAVDSLRDVLAAHGIEPVLVDYTVVPPTPEELKKWSLALNDIGLVRRSDPMFFALQLDDRFLSENDFWLAVSQHPTLINGPILRMGSRLGICKSADDVRRFLGLEASAQKPKGLSPRLSALIRGEALPPVEDDEEEEDEIEDVFVEAAPVKDVAKAKPVLKAKAAAAKPKAAAAKKAPAAKAKKR